MHVRAHMQRHVEIVSLSIRSWVMGVRSHQERGGGGGGGGRNLLIIHILSILFIDALYDAIQDNKCPLVLKSKLQN